MDIERILKGRSNRQTRGARPFTTCFEAISQCLRAGEAIVNGAEPSDHVALLERSVVITSVTAIEVYFRDILDFMFKYCDPDFFEPKLKQLHQNKYDIVELVEVYRHQLHPLELVVNDISFQSAEKIEKTFSMFLKGGLWSEVCGLQVRIKESPENVVSFDHENLDELKRTFALRHELVHNPGRRLYLNESVLGDLRGALFMVFGADVVLSSMLEQNRSPEIKGESGA